MMVVDDQGTLDPALEQEFSFTTIAALSVVALTASDDLDIVAIPILSRALGRQRFLSQAKDTRIEHFLRS